MKSLLATAVDLAAAIVAAPGDAKATADPRRATSSAIVLVPPPVRDYRQKLDTFTLLCLAGTTTQDLDTLTKLSAVVEDLRAALPGQIEEARPTTYQLAGPDSPAFPAYACRYAATTPQES